jgi:hypothetical protein
MQKPATDDIETVANPNDVVTALVADEALDLSSPHRRFYRSR